jgi:hypothetical protein
MTAAPFLRPRPLRDLSDPELKSYYDHCHEQVASCRARLAYLEGRLDEVSKGFRKDGILTFTGAGISAAGMVGIAFFTPAGIVAVAGGVLSLLSLDGFGSKARNRNLLRIDVRNLNESIRFYSAELERISIEKTRRDGGSR